MPVTPRQHACPSDWKNTMPKARLLLRFPSAQGGNIAVIFALASLPLLAFTGVAIDFGLATRLQVKLQAATDATALNLCQTPQSTTQAQMQLQANAMETGYMNAPSLAVDPVVLTAGTTSTPRQIKLSAHVNSGTQFSAFTKVVSPKVSASAQCTTPIPKTFEIALVLDNTGSMNESSGSTTKIQAVQTAASSFVDYVKNNGAFSPSSRIAIVPFAAAVAVDPVASATASWVDTRGLSAYHWTNVDQTQARALNFTSRLSIFNALKGVNFNWGWAGCFETPPYPQNVQDGAPLAGTTQAAYNTLYVPLFAPDEPGNGSTGYAAWDPSNNTSGSATNYSFNSYIDDTNGTASCPSSSTSFFSAENQACKYLGARNPQPTASNPYTGIPNGPNLQCLSKPLQRLTTDASALKALINSLTAAGSTNIHEGMMWGWRTLSPSSVFADGGAYSVSTVNKVLVLMTDGANTWPGNPYNYNQSQYFSLAYINNADGSHPNPHLPTNYQSVSTATQQRAALDELTIEACANAKAAGISIWTIGFSVPSDPIDNQGIKMLQSCATSASQAFVANDSSGLISAFDQIAKSIGSLRLSQ